MKLVLIFGMFGIGIIAGLRTFTAPAVICWAALVGWLSLSESRLSFIGTPIAVGIASLLAVGELIVDKLPGTPNRTTVGPLSGRVATGAFSAIAVALAARQSVAISSMLGVVGAFVGAFGGYYARRFLVKGRNFPDFAVALTEDLVAVAGGLFLVRQIV